jgi:hypothetical protein
MSELSDAIDGLRLFQRDIPLGQVKIKSSVSCARDEYFNNNMPKWIETLIQAAQKSSQIEDAAAGLVKALEQAIELVEEIGIDKTVQLTNEMVPHLMRWRKILTDFNSDNTEVKP